MLYSHRDACLHKVLCLDPRFTEQERPRNLLCIHGGNTRRSGIEPRPSSPRVLGWLGVQCPQNIPGWGVTVTDGGDSAGAAGGNLRGRVEMDEDHCCDSSKPSDTRKISEEHMIYGLIAELGKV